ncbi:MAG TPA: hypothetical protein VGM88_16775 [Kofleriaceae bacterium]|jgi:hypothetical protein
MRGLVIVLALAACGGGSSDPGDNNGPDGGGSDHPDGSHPGSDGSGGPLPVGFSYTAYKDTGINMDWNTNTISSSVSGTRTPLVQDIAGNAVTLAFATGACGSENWGGVQGDALATANAAAFAAAGVHYIVSTGGASGTFTCDDDAAFETFVSRWQSATLDGIDFDIEAGQSADVIDALVARVATAHAAHPSLRFSFTLGSLGPGTGATAQSLGGDAMDSLNVYGDNTLAAIAQQLGFTGDASTWPAYVTINLMTMDYGSTGQYNCIVSGSSCEMGQSAIQAAYNLHDHQGVPYSGIELTPMIGGNDTPGETFTLDDASAVGAFVQANSLAGLHFWSYDRDTDCAPGSSSPTCNSLGTAGNYGFLHAFAAAL